MHRKIAGVGFILLLLVPLVYFVPKALVAGSPWMSASPDITKTERSTSLEDFNDIRSRRQGYTAGLECIEKRIAIRAFGTLSIQFKTDCWYNTEIGLLSRSGDYLLQPGEEVAANIFVSSNPYTQTQLVPTPNPNVFLEIVPAPAVGYGGYLRFRTLEELLFTRERHPTGTVTLRYAVGPRFELKNAGGSPVHMQSSYAWWSPDNKYMLIWTRFGQLYRVDLENFKVLSVFVSTKPSGQFLDGSVATSPTGRYAAVAVEKTAFSDFVLLDLDSCNQAELPYVTSGATCGRRSFKSELQRSVPSFSVPFMPRFYGEHTLGVYHRQSSSTDFDQYLLQASGTEFESSDYVALGDSFSSGEGAGDYIPGTDILGTNMCHTSTNSYPYLINQQLNLTDFLSVACSGARMENFWRDGQYKQSSALYSDSHPGVTPQQNHIEAVSAVTITMSGNDIGFKEKLEYCLVWSSDCYSSYEKRLQIANEIKDLHKDLAEMYGHILRSNSRLYVLGYPQIISRDEAVKCGTNAPMNTYQRDMANDLITYFNAVIKSAATHAGAYYAGTEDALSGHKLCEGPSATLAINGITLGDDIGVWKLRGLSNGTFHPNLLGHQLLKDAALGATGNLTQPMPKPDASVPIPDPEAYPFLDAPTRGQLMRRLYYNPKAKPSLLQVGGKVLISVTNPGIPVAPLSTFDVYLHSEPTELGQITSDAAGFIHAWLNIPKQIPPGMHELHIQGTAEDGTPIDIYEFVYIAFSDEDFDGDGVLNQDELCGIIQSSGQDEDKDSVDDACDALVPSTATERRDEETAGDSQQAGQVRVDVSPLGVGTDTSYTSPESESTPPERNVHAATTTNNAQRPNNIEEKLNKLPLVPALILLGVTMSTVTLIYHLRYAKG